MSEVLVDRNAGSHFGNLTELGDIGKDFDGVTLANNPQFGAYRGSPATSGYSGTTWATPKVFSKAVCHGWNDRGFIDNGNGASCTLEIYGKNGTPAHETDGALLGSLTFIDQLDESAGRTVSSNGNATPFTSIWRRIVATGGNGICSAELVLYEVTDGVPQPTTTPPPSPPPAAGNPRALFLLWGQSHMVGWAQIQDQSAYRNRSRIKTFQNGQWVAAADPLSLGEGPFEWGWMGCGMPMANAMVPLLPDYEIAPIVCAHGSTSINQWMPGQTLYNAAVATWHNAISAAPVGSFVAGMVSWQGESDNGSPSGWGTKRLQIASAIRGEFALPELPDVMICCDIRWTGILAEQLGMGLPKNMARVRTDDFTPPSAGDLKDPAQYRTVGDRACWALRSLMLR